MLMSNSLLEMPVPDEVFSFQSGDSQYYFYKPPRDILVELIKCGVNSYPDLYDIDIDTIEDHISIYFDYWLLVDSNYEPIVLWVAYYPNMEKKEFFFSIFVFNQKLPLLICRWSKWIADRYIDFDYALFDTKNPLFIRFGFWKHKIFIVEKLNNGFVRTKIVLDHNNEDK